MNIKKRLIDLKKKQVELIPELNKRGIKASPSDVSKAINGYWLEPKAERILKACDEIVTEWEGRKIVTGDTSKGVYNGTCTDIR